MTHDELKEKILGLYDGPVTEKERVWAENHLASCQNCRQAVEEYKNFAAVLFNAPTYSEAQEDMFTAKVMVRVKELEASSRQSAADIAIRWFIPLLGSTIVAAWVFFSLLPSTPELSNALNGSAFFASDAHEITASAWNPEPTSKSNEEIVVSWMKE
jgi:anti-sigma factor RsiW